MSLGCAAGSCGDCCNPVHLSSDQRDVIDGWRDWLAEHQDDPPRDGSDAAFILAHWHQLERRETGTTYRCDRFDPDTRTCTAHEDRPAVCRDFPWYGDAPTSDGFRKGSQCSYLLDVAPADRPEGSRPLIPIEVL